MLSQGCPDACEQACASSTARLAECLDDWSASWEDLGASSRQDFRQNCQNDWSLSSPSLESREQQPALAACQELEDELAAVSCDELEAIYLP